MKPGTPLVDKAIIVLAVFAVLWTAARWLAFLSPPYDSTDPPGGRSGLTLHTDELTGCQYLRGPWGGITPRMGPDGRQLCEGAL